MALQPRQRLDHLYCLQVALQGVGQKLLWLRVDVFIQVQPRSSDNMLELVVDEDLPEIDKVDWWVSVVLDCHRDTSNASHDIESVYVDLSFSEIRKH